MPPSIRLASERVELESVNDNGPKPRIFTPGEIVQQGTDNLRGHGTYLDGEVVKSSVAGIPKQIMKCLIVLPIKKRYSGEVGDVVVGRITELQMKRWKVDTNARLDSVLLLSSVNLPGGELRRRSSEDEATMRKYLQEGDLICAEVHQVFHDRSLSLYTRSLKYGKLGQGTLVKVFPSLIMKQKTRFHNFPWGTSAILGNNGYIFIYPTSQRSMQEDREDLKEKDALGKTVSREERENVARVRNCIVALAHYKQMLYDTSITVAYEISKKFKVTLLMCLLFCEWISVQLGANSKTVVGRGTLSNSENIKETVIIRRAHFLKFYVWVLGNMAIANGRSLTAKSQLPTIASFVGGV